MIDLDGIDLLGLENGTSAFTIDASAGFEIGASPADLQWVPRRIGAVPNPNPSMPPLETTLPMICVAEEADDLLAAMGEMRFKVDEINASGGSGGTEIAWQMIGATDESALICYGARIGPVKITAEDRFGHVGRFELTITCAPYILGAEYLAAEGIKPTGIPAADVTIADCRGDMPGPARVVITNGGSEPQSFLTAGLQWRDAIAGNEMLLRASTFDTSGPLMNGTYVSGTNEVQTLTKSGTISGGTWPLSLDGIVFDDEFAHDASVSAVQAAIDAQIGSGKITVGGSPLSTGNMTFTFAGEFGARDMGDLTFSSSALTGGGSVTHSTSTPGASGYVAGGAYSDYSALMSTGNQTDIGSYTIWALVRDEGSDPGASRIRGRVTAGDASVSVANRAVSIPVNDKAIWVNLGPSHVARAASGPHQWSVVVEVATTGTEGAEVRILDLLKVPSEHGRIVVKSPLPQAFTTVAVDDFDAASGALNARSSDLGGSWATSGSGADFTVNTSAQRIERTAVSDSAGDGRLALLGPDLTTTQIHGALSGAGEQDDDLRLVVFRGVDINNFAGLGLNQVSSVSSFVFYKVEGGVPTTVVLESGILSEWWGFGTTIKATVNLDGSWHAEFLPNYEFSGSDASLAFGGSLDTGKIGYYDQRTSASAGTRRFSAFAPFTGLGTTASDAVVHPSRSAVWRHNGLCEREAASGVNYAHAAGARQAGVPVLGPAGVDDLDNRMAIALAAMNPDFAAKSSDPSAFSYEVHHRPAFQIGSYGAAS